MHTESTWKRVMAGLAYPAVLGNIIYMLFQSFERLNTQDALAPSKFLLLALTAAFYLCDFMYLTFTKQFGALFFALDSVFVVLLFWTIHLIGVWRPADDPGICGISMLFAIFMALYFLWDLIEFWRLKSTPRTDPERNFYLKMFTWEGLSLAGFLSILCIPRLRTSEALCVALLLVTAAFACLLVSKGRYFRA